MVLSVGLEGAEAEPVLGAGAECGEGGAVLGGAVTDVFFKTIAGILLSEIDHILIAGNFGDDGGGGDFFNEVVGAF